MKYLMINRLIFLLLLTMIWPSSVLAFIGTASVTNLSGSNNISRTDSSTVNLRWSMQSFGASPGSRITSQNGQFRDGMGGVIGTNNRVLVKTITPIPNATTNVTIAETLRIPSSVLYTANQRGLSQIIYQRTFTDCPAADCNTLQPALSITFNLTGSSGAAFNVTSYKLRFDYDQVATVIKQGSELKATAYINVTRTGTIRGVWEVAMPSSTAGIPVYRSLRTVQRQLTSFATNPIESPSLPRNATGAHLVRFRFLEPQLSGNIPTLQYQVIARTTVLKTISLLQPQNGTIISGQPSFSWEPITGVSAYKLELIEAPVATEQPKNTNEYIPVAGMMITPENTQAKPNTSIVKKLHPGRVYWWHIIGLDDKGQYIGKSAWRSVQMK